MKFTKKIIVSILVVAMSLILALTLTACIDLSGKFVFSEINVSGDTDNYLGELLGSNEAKEKLNGTFVEFKLSGEVEAGKDGVTKKLNFVVKDGIVTFQENGKAATFAKDMFKDIEDMIPEEFKDVFSYTTKVKFSGTKVTFEASVQTSEEVVYEGTAVPALNITVQLIFVKA